MCFYLYISLSLTLLFFLFLKQTSQWTDMMLCKSNLKGTTSDKPSGENQYGKQWTSDSPTTRQVPLSRCQKYIPLVIKVCLHKPAKDTILGLNVFLICFIHILNACGWITVVKGCGVASSLTGSSFVSLQFCFHREGKYTSQMSLIPPLFLLDRSEIKRRSNKGFCANLTLLRFSSETETSASPCRV